MHKKDLTRSKLLMIKPLNKLRIEILSQPKKKPQPFKPIKLNGERLKSFLLQSEGISDKDIYSDHFYLCCTLYLEVPAEENKDEKEKYPDWKEVKLY